MLPKSYLEGAVFFLVRHCHLLKISVELGRNSGRIHAPLLQHVNVATVYETN